MFITTHTVQFNGKTYPPGAEITLPAEEAERLEGLGAITRKMVEAGSASAAPPNAPTGKPAGPAAKAATGKTGGASPSTGKGK